MRHDVVFFVAAICLCFSATARGKQASDAPTSSQVENPTSANSSRDCIGNSAAEPEARQVADGDTRLPLVQPDAAGALGTADAAPTTVHLEEDLKILEQRQSGLAQCVLAANERVAEQNPQGACLGELLLNFEMRHDGEPERDIPIGQLAGSRAFFYESGMTIDADGAPNAYHPDKSGLDDLATAGTPGSWEGLAKDSDGEPFIQGPNDPFPGYYVSATALTDRSKAVSDPTRYVDASRIPFVVLPGGMARELGARVGDFAVVFNQRNGRISYAIFGDVGPYDRIGEGSMALAENLGVRSDARNGGTRRGIVYLVFPGSGNGRPRTIEEISAEGQKLVQDWETSIATNACALSRPALPVVRNQTTD
jgi:hypothetical protein